MHTFHIWAPRAQKLRIIVDGATYDMRAEDDRGHWSADIEAAHHGSNYAFLVNDDPHPYPDPRSYWQPRGVHEASRVYDHTQFAWKTPADWNAPSLAQAVFYELHIGTFTPEGTLDALIAKLLYLKEIGITHVELMPVASYEGRWGWGYDGVAIFAPHEPYGGPDGLKRFVDAAHACGLAVALDVVYNHFGPAGNYTGVFAPYLDSERGNLWGSVVNLHGDGQENVRRFFCDNALMWMRGYRIDVLRLDAIHALNDESEPYFLTQLAEEVEALGREMGRKLALIAESDYNDAIIVTPRGYNGQGGGRGIDAQWSDDLHHTLHTVLTGEHQGYYVGFGSIAQLAQALQRIFVRRPHDGASGPGIPPHDVGHLTADHFFGYIQDHDQVGNRAHGERIHHLAGMRAARVAAAIILMGPSVPLLFQGEEFAASTPFLFFADHSDPTLRANVAKGRRTEFAAFGWADNIPDPEDPSSFERSKLRWKEVTQGDHAAMLAWYRSLLQLRRAEPALTNPDLTQTQVVFDEATRWLMMTRQNICLACNLSGEPREFALSSKASLLLVSEEDAEWQGGKLRLAPMSAAVLRLG